MDRAVAINSVAGTGPMAAGPAAVRLPIAARGLLLIGPCVPRTR